MKDSYDVLIVGVGGQGTILASNILGEACVIEGVPVKGAETHGMAQRGGSVESHVRIGGRFGPLISPGTADLLISFDLLEALRYSHFLKEKGRLLTATGLVVPVSVYQQKLSVPDPDELTAALGETDARFIDAEKCAAESGSVLAQNVVMLGAASHDLPLSLSSLQEAVSRCVPNKTIDINLRAFDLGREAGRG